MKIYNTLTKKVEDFVPNEAGKVKCTPAAQPFIILRI